MRALLAAFVLFSAAPAFPAGAPPLPRSTPEAQGISSSAILAFIEAVEARCDALHGVVVVRHGHVVAEGWWEPYRKEDPHVLFSLSKSFASTGIGLAQAEGLLSVDDTVLSFFPEDAPAEPSENLRAMRVRDLLAMSSGQHGEAIRGFDYTASGLAARFLSLPVAHKPGTHWVYNTPGSYMLSAIVQEVSDTTLLDYLGPRLFGPLGIRDPTWEASADGVSMGGYGLKVRTEDIARFGQLYLQKGEWQGQRILPAEWVEAATKRQASNGSNPESDWEQGYGYQFWRCKNDVYRGDGAFGQFCVVMPRYDAVVAINSGLNDLQTPLNLVYEHLLSSMKPDALPLDERGHRRLQDKLASLTLPPQPGTASPARGKEISGRLYTLPEHDGPFQAVGLEIGDETVLVARVEGEERRFAVGSGTWERGGTLPLEGRIFEYREEPVALTGAWTTEDTFAAKACFHETPFCLTLSLEFAGDVLLYEQEMNVGFDGDRKQASLVGRLEH